MDNITEINQRLMKEFAEVLVLMIPSSLFEVVCICGLARALRASTGTDIVVIVRPEHADVAQLYRKDISAVLTTTCKVMLALTEIHKNQALGRPQKGIPYCATPWVDPANRLIRIHDLIEERPGFGISLIDLCRYALGLEWHAPLSLARLDQETQAWGVEYCARNLISRDRAVLILPGANSTVPMKVEIWQEVANFYKLKGWQVLLNHKGSTWIPKGIGFLGENINLSVKQTLAVVETIGSVITAGSGIVGAFLATQVNASVHCLSPRILLANSVDDGRQQFIPKSASTNFFYVAPELINASENFYQWQVPENESDYEFFLEDLFRGIRNRFTMKPSMDKKLADVYFERLLVRD